MIHKYRILYLVQKYQKCIIIEQVPIGMPALLLYIMVRNVFIDCFFESGPKIVHIPIGISLQC